MLPLAMTARMTPNYTLLGWTRLRTCWAAPDYTPVVATRDVAPDCTPAGAAPTIRTRGLPLTIRILGWP
jgi:hypothetical protein